MKTKSNWGKKSIKLSIYFSTESIPCDLDKTAWSHGKIELGHNVNQRIEKDSIDFTQVDDILDKIKELLKKNNIKLLVASKIEEVKL